MRLNNKNKKIILSFCIVLGFHHLCNNKTEKSGTCTVIWNNTGVPLLSKIINYQKTTR